MGDPVDPPADGRRRRELGRRRRAGVAVMLALAAAFLLACGQQREAASSEILVFAAASLQDALSELQAPFEQSSASRLSFNFAGSNVLAQQIIAAPVADVFLSADEAWMDRVEQSGRLAPRSRRILLSNRLVVVAHPRSPIDIEGLADLAAADFSFLSIGDPQAVPAGRYARSAMLAVPFGKGSVWDALADRVVPAPDVRAALALVEADELAVGIVYRSDVGDNSDEVRVLVELEGAVEPPIRYSAALVEGAVERAPEAPRYLDFLGGRVAREVFERHGFVLLP